MRPKYLLGIIVGALMLYIGIFGSLGFTGMFAIGASLPVREDFDALTWSSYDPNAVDPVINPAGQLELKAAAPNATLDTRCEVSSIEGGAAVSNVKQYTVRTRMSGEWNSQPGDSFGSRIDIYMATTGANFWDVGINATHIWSGWATWVTSSDQDTSFHNYTFLVTVTSSGIVNMDIYKDLAKIGTGVAGATSGGGRQLILRAAQGSLIHFDYIYIDSGLHPPTGSDSGNIDAYCVANGTPVQGVYVTATGPETKSATSDSSGHALISGVKTGTYIVSGTYNGMTPEATALVTKDTTTPVTLDFSSAPPGKASLSVSATDRNGNPLSANVEVKLNSVTVKTGTTPCGWNDLEPATYDVIVTYDAKPAQTFSKTITTTSPGVVIAVFDVGGGFDPWQQFKQAIVAFLDNTIVRTLCLSLGALTTIVSCIMLLWPEKHSAPPAVRPLYT